MITWLILTFINMIIPVTMIAFGGYFIKFAPKEISATFGYRSARSMKNKENWEFAHHYCGRIWFWVGWATLIITAIAMGLLFRVEGDSRNTFSLILTGLQFIALVSPIYPTERALKKREQAVL